MLRLVAGEDLQVIKVVEGADGARAGIGRGRVVGKMGDDVEGFEHIAGELRGVGPRGDGDGDLMCAAGVEDGGDGGVEGE